MPSWRDDLYQTLPRCTMICITSNPLTVLTQHGRQAASRTAHRMGATSTAYPERDQAFCNSFWTHQQQRRHCVAPANRFTVLNTPNQFTMFNTANESAVLLN